MTGGNIDRRAPAPDAAPGPLVAHGRQRAIYRLEHAIVLLLLVGPGKEPGQQSSVMPQRAVSWAIRSEKQPGGSRVAGQQQPGIVVGRLAGLVGLAGDRRPENGGGERV
jgi:hypothetical protein